MNHDVRFTVKRRLRHLKLGDVFHFNGANTTKCVVTGDPLDGYGGHTLIPWNIHGCSFDQNVFALGSVLIFVEKEPTPSDCYCPDNVIRGTTMECQVCWDKDRANE